ncbi:hypothetical protein GCM10011354_08030 [Egicoccus halophilus]|uniref:ATP-grasp domain-containing protein n=1 Tax=Egicoccus halophilus TaxID=1670830 RepID=A0A8J3A6F1_9ACTN|nr:hypothetical protein GCM10011354_08030 [Egicoccus halophilus]
MYAALDDATGALPAVTALRTARVLLLPRRRILFQPATPSRHQIAWRLLLLCGYRMVESSDERHDVVFAHDPRTSHPPVRVAGNRAARIVNADATDVAKRTVAARFAEVFGYALHVDPTTHQGPAIRKSNENYRHDAVVVTCPYRPAPDEDPDEVTYQRYVDTRAADGCFEDLRVPVYDGQVPLVYRKHHPDTATRFSEFAHSEVVLDPRTLLSAQELARIGELARALSVDYAEMDVLRDTADGRIYVVDVNPTPAGLYKGFTQQQRRLALQTLRPAFAALVERRCR